MFRHVHVTFCDVDVTSVSEEYIRLMGMNRRVNFFEVPWTASTPGHGVLLVTSEQLKKIRDYVSKEEHKGYGPLVLGVKKRETEDDDWEDDTDQSVTFPKIYPIKATPVFGMTYRHGEVTEDGTPDSATHGPDTLDNCEGFYELEVQDARCSFLDAFPLKGVNVQKAPFDGNSFVNSTTNNGSPWKVNELVNRALPKNAVNVPGVAANGILRDIYVGALPRLVAVDLILHAAGIGHPLRFDPSEWGKGGTERPFGYGTKRLDELLGQDKFLPLRVTGGSVYVFDIAKVKPDAVFRKNPQSTAEDFSDYLVPTLTDKDPYPIVLSGTRSSESLQFDFRSDTFLYHGLFRGFLKEFLNVDWRISLVAFQWYTGIPTTEVCVSSSSPMATLLHSPTGKTLRGLPTRNVVINGDIGLPDKGGSGRVGFEATIEECDNTTGMCRVGNVVAKLGKDGFHQVQDLVAVIPIEPDPSAGRHYKWYVVDKIKGIKYRASGTGNLPQARAWCSNSVPAPVAET